MFDADFFFSRGFLETLQEFSRDHGEYGDENLRVEVVTLTGDRLDTMQLDAVENGTRLSTRDQRLVFVPYQQIAYLDVSILQDHRVAGFRLSTRSESLARRS